jgi:hypothetical protein
LRSNASNSATRRVNTPTRASRSASAASNRASRSSSSTVDGESDTPYRMHQTTHQDRASQIKNLLNGYLKRLHEDVGQIILLTTQRCTATLAKEPL